jgi:hypothetical protein
LLSVFDLQFLGMKFEVLAFYLKGLGIFFFCSLRSLFQALFEESDSCPSLFLVRPARGGWARCVRLGPPANTPRQSLRVLAFGISILA